MIVGEVADLHPAASSERVTALTCATQSRQEAVDEEPAQSESQAPSFIRHVKGRATPRWRQGLR